MAKTRTWGGSSSSGWLSAGAAAVGVSSGGGAPSAAPRHSHQCGDQVLEYGLHKLVGGLGQLLGAGGHSQLAQEDADVLLREQRRAEGRHGEGSTGAASSRVC